MGKQFVKVLFAFILLFTVGCDDGSEEPAAAEGSSVNTAPQTVEQRQEAVEESLNNDVTGGSECLGSPLVGSCFEILQNSCYQPQGSCVEEASGQQNIWTWEDGTQMIFDYAGLDETATVWSAAMTGLTSDGEPCIQGVMEFAGITGERIITLQIDGEVIERVDFYDEFALPATKYTCSDGSSFTVPVGDMTLADACMFGPNAEPCGFLKPATLEFDATPEETEASE